MKTSYRNLQNNKSWTAAVSEQILFYLYTSKYILSSFCKQGFKFKTHLLQQEPDGFQEVRQMFVYVGIFN